MAWDKISRLPIWERMLASYNVNAETGCYIWHRAKSKAGYGQLHYLGTLWYAHRLSWFLNNGPIPAGMFVLHHCDNPPCINPAHLFLGNDGDNQRDKQRKGRAANKLTTEQAAKIKHDDRPPSIVAREFKIHPSMVWLIKTGKSWSHIA